MLIGARQNTAFWQGRDLLCPKGVCKGVIVSATHGLEVEICYVRPMSWYFIVLCVFYNATLNYQRHLDCPHNNVLWLLLSLQGFITRTSKIGSLRPVKLPEPKEENMSMDHAFLNPPRNMSTWTRININLSQVRLTH